VLDAGHDVAAGVVRSLDQSFQLRDQAVIVDRELNGRLAALLLNEQGFGGQQISFSLCARIVEGDMAINPLTRLGSIAELDGRYHDAIGKRERSLLQGMESKILSHVHPLLVIYI